MMLTAFENIVIHAPSRVLDATENQIFRRRQSCTFVLEILFKTLQYVSPQWEQTDLYTTKRLPIVFSAYYQFRDHQMYTNYIVLARNIEIFSVQKLVSRERIFITHVIFNGVIFPFWKVHLLSLIV